MFRRRRVAVPASGCHPLSGGAPFEALRDHILPELTTGPRDRPINIWCAASSSGQEPYSLAMLLIDHYPHLADGRARIVATDLSSQALSRARSGLFNSIEIGRGVPRDVLDRHFERQDGQYRVAERVKRVVEFRQINLLRDPPPLPALDLMLMRNVLVYFDSASRAAVLQRAAAMMAHGGYLLLGSSEGAVGDAGLEVVRHGRTRFYRRNSPAWRGAP